jgi:hypothetical protein
MNDFERRLDELSRAVVEGRQTRRSVLKLGFGVLGAAVASAFPARVWAGHQPGHQADNNSAAAHFCNALFAEDDPRRGECKSTAAHGEGPFFECGGDPTRFCVDKCCREDQICNAATGECLSPGGTQCGPLRVCFEGTTCCHVEGSLFGACCLPGDVCCAAGGIFGGATCCPPGLPVCLRPGGGAVGCGPR